MTAMMRAKDFVSGSEVSFNAGALASCALCCYAAIFWAQIAVLERLGIRQPKWSHDGLRNKFGLEVVKKRHLFTDEEVKFLREAYQMRNEAHYSDKELSRKRVERLLRHTKEFVEKVNTIVR
ncbi:MAG: HEPN domain-containing protein [Armatimonadetes bacterium]|nr:HEPN domain-containing protein [Armatimonadota bacterium]MDW8030064.1 HEPN domain-containing protein [Armatimonadota bacterium]